LVASALECSGRREGGEGGGGSKLPQNVSAPSAILQLAWAYQPSMAGAVPLALKAMLVPYTPERVLEVGQREASWRAARARVVFHLGGAMMGGRVQEASARDAVNGLCVVLDVPVIEGGGACGACGRWCMLLREPACAACPP